eukprot:TRINITY_DN16974_c0_g2_i1.p1 TRINITY_DN16974_c0_g2~~TRINITY_DN16974_c0_g2_i1.p1  ORF type:complete len:237 (-),score=50.07 TRINITY_DN16974_c0_g2_i1:53-763(-)
MCIRDRVKYPSLMCGEATPSYLLHADLAAIRMKALAPNTRLVAILRDPVERCWSHYQMCTDMVGTPQQLLNRGCHATPPSFEQAIGEDMECLAQTGVTPDKFEDAKNSFVLSYLQQDFPMDHGGHSWVSRGLYALQLSVWLDHFPREQLLVVRLEEMSTPEGLSAVTARVMKHVGLPEYRIKDLEPKNQRGQSKIPQELRERLAQFYTPWNLELERLLGPGWSPEATGWTQPSPSP